MRFFGMMFQASGGGRKNDMSEISGRRYNSTKNRIGRNRGWFFRKLGTKKE